MKIGDFVFAEYDNGEIVNGEIVKVRTMIDGSTLQERLLLTVKCEQGYRSIYTDKCVSFDHEDQDMIAARKEIENISFEEYNSLPTHKG